MQESPLIVLVARALFFGAIPLGFTLASAALVAARQPRLLPVVVTLGLYQAVCVLVLYLDRIPAQGTLILFALAFPSTLALAGSAWSFASTKLARERALGVAVSVLGCALTGGQVALYVTAVWGTI